jgi:sugar diacid utilization regulator
MLLSISLPGEDLAVDRMAQAEEVLKLFLRVWRLTHSRLCELDALLHGAAAGQWDREIKALTVIRNTAGTSLDHISEELTLVRLLRSDETFTTNFDRQVTYFSGSIVIAELTEKLELEKLMRKLKKDLRLTAPVCAGRYAISGGNANIPQLYSYILDALPLACKIFPDYTVFTNERLAFAHDVFKISGGFGADTNEVFRILDPLLADDRWPRHHETLDVFFLDCDGSITASAERLGIHTNTMKYRLRVISELLEQDIQSSLSSSRIVIALALLRAQG